MRRSFMRSAIALLYFVSGCLVVVGLRAESPSPSAPAQTFQVLRIVPDATAHAPVQSSPPRIAKPRAHAALAPGSVTRKASHRAGLSPGQLMLRAIARIPGYRPGAARWVLTARYGHWGATDMFHLVVYISPYVPPSKMYSVVVHEWSHVLTVLDYGLDVYAAVNALERVYGGQGWLPAERAADCMARMLGATWTNYTSCTSSSWRAAARRLLAGERV